MWYQYQTQIALILHIGPTEAESRPFIEFIGWAYYIDEVYWEDIFPLLAGATKK